MRQRDIKLDRWIEILNLKTTRPCPGPYLTATQRPNIPYVEPQNQRPDSSCPIAYAKQEYFHVPV